eukprot:TRINITY_DN6191_c1_g2_i2.p1 TRINITY_DN6191_c1_g2~~TRINITY_DN6191_c1_g2_i2.p1  ORF type:complete len:375 (+),score=73.30 TRINITY_DN6191_c1_g2_i2:263-1387(+)
MKTSHAFQFITIAIIFAGFAPCIEGMLLADVLDRFFTTTPSVSTGGPAPAPAPVPTPTSGAPIIIVPTEAPVPSTPETPSEGPATPVTFFLFDDEKPRETTPDTATDVPVETPDEPETIDITEEPTEPVEPVEPEEPVETPETPEIPEDTGCITVVEGMNLAGDFTLMLRALEAAGLTETLSDPEVVGTIFVVQDKYFEAALAKFNLDFEVFIGDAFVDRVMAYHVLNQVVLVEDMVEGAALTTALPEALLYVNRDEADGIELVPIVTDFNATLLEKDISLCGVVAHTLDNVLIPSFNEAGDVLPHPGIDVDIPLTPTILEDEIVPVPEPESELIEPVEVPVTMEEEPAEPVRTIVPSSGTDAPVIIPPSNTSG